MHGIDSSLSQFPLQLDIRDLKLVAAIAQTGNLTNAAKVLHLTQSTLSHHLAHLEDRINKPLFHRSGKRMLLTPVGDCFRTAADSILKGIESMEFDLAHANTKPRTELRFATECYTTYPWFGRMAREFTRRYPHVELKLVTEATPRPLLELEAGSIDIAITSDRLADRKLQVKELFSDELVAVVASDHPWAGKKRIAVEDFRDVHLLTYSANPMESDFVREVLLPAGIVPRKTSGIQLTEGLLEFARARLGVPVLAKWAVGSASNARGLVLMRIGPNGIERKWKAAWMRNHPSSEMLIAFAKLLCSRAWIS